MPLTPLAYLKLGGAVLGFGLIIALVIHLHGEFATWRAARAVGDHDLNSFLVRVDPETPNDSIEPGMTVRLAPGGSR